MTKDKLIEKLESIHACGDAVKWVKSCPAKTDQEVWSTCERGDWMLWLIGAVARNDTVKRKRLVLTACKCARLALTHVPEGEKRPLIAIETAEKWANDDDSITIADVKAAAAAAHTAAYVAADAAYVAADVAADAAYDAAYVAADVAADAADVAADVAAYVAADVAAYVAADVAAYAADAAAAAAAAADAAADAAAAVAADAYAADAARMKTLAECARITLADWPKIEDVIGT